MITGASVAGPFKGDLIGIAAEGGVVVVVAGGSGAIAGGGRI